MYRGEKEVEGLEGFYCIPNIDGYAINVSGVVIEVAGEKVLPFHFGNGYDYRRSRSLAFFRRIR